MSFERETSFVEPETYFSNRTIVSADDNIAIDEPVLNSENHVSASSPRVLVRNPSISCSDDDSSTSQESDEGKNSLVQNIPNVLQLPSKSCPKLINSLTGNTNVRSTFSDTQIYNIYCCSSTLQDGLKWLCTGKYVFCYAALLAIFIIFTSVYFSMPHRNLTHSSNSYNGKPIEKDIQNEVENKVDTQVEAEVEAEFKTICATDLRSGMPQNFNRLKAMDDENKKGGKYVFEHDGYC